MSSSVGALGQEMMLSSVIQPFSTAPSLQDLARIFLPVKQNDLLHVNEEQTSSVQQDLGGCLLVFVLTDESS